jgi:aminoglycoside 6-adenylyltransferase
VDRRVSELLEEIAAWARGREDVRAVLLVGSQARRYAGRRLFGRRRGAIRRRPRALPSRCRLGALVWRTLLTFFEPTAVGGFEERRVLFDDGLEVDFSILATGIANAPPPDAEAVLARGFSILYDGIGLPTLEPPG